jgi:uncharacterized protein YdcH (DUF465 family)
VAIDNLRERKEQREIEDLKAEVAQLTRQLGDERDKLDKERRGNKEADRKLIQKEIVNLEKQVTSSIQLSLCPNFRLVLTRSIRS